MDIKHIIACILCLATFSFISCDDDHHFGQATATGDDSQMILQGKVGNDNNANIVYVDFSANKQYQVSRTSWHIGLYCGDESRVILNQSYSRAFSTKRTNFASISSEDAEDCPDLAAGMMGFGALADIKVCDDTSHDLSKTVFGDISKMSLKTKYFYLL